MKNSVFLGGVLQKMTITYGGGGPSKSDLKWRHFWVGGVGVLQKMIKHDLGGVGVQEGLKYGDIINEWPLITGGRSHRDNIASGAIRVGGIGR